MPKGRTAASAMSLDGQADALVAFHFDDVRALPATAPPPAADHATFRTFDGQVIEFSGHRDGEKAYVTVNASRDPALAAKFRRARAPTPAKPAPPAPRRPANPPRRRAAANRRQTVASSSAARAKGVEYEIPVYKYEAIFKPQEELLEKPAAAREEAAAGEKAAAGEEAVAASESARSGRARRRQQEGREPGEHERARIEHHRAAFEHALHEEER